MVAWDQQLSDESPGYSGSKKILRHGEYRTVGRWLLWAAVLCLIRVALLPWMMKISEPGAYGTVTDVDVVTQGLILMVCFALCGMLARMRPLTATMIAMTYFGFVTYNDLQRYADIYDAGIIHKSVLAMMLLRGFMTALVTKLV